MGLAYSSASICAVNTIFALALVLAHHSTANYDSTKTVKLVGTVTSVGWRNPHVRIYVDVPAADGKVVHWDVETLSASQMSVRGLTNGFLKPGDHVTIDAFVAKDGEPRAFVRILTLPDGTMVDGPPADRN